ncbi:hypothetical protein QUF72_08740 [Desulfobacterales bacterium HSG2]|nr:hypothetical protein [Desulfobacterales bacterium HSG2]
MLTKADWTIKVLSSLKKLPFVNDLEIIRPPGNVKADMGILLKIKDKKSSDGLVVADTISDLQWKIFDETGDLPAIYWCWQKI